MSNVWISTVYNYTDTNFRLYQNDFWHRPQDMNSGKKYAADEEILIEKAEAREAPRVYRFEQFSVPWVNPGDVVQRRLRIKGPTDGELTFDVGPTGDEDRDYVRGVDGGGNQLVTLPLSKRGTGNTAWLRLRFRDDGLIWELESAENWGDLLWQEAFQDFRAIALDAAPELIAVLIKLLTPKSASPAAATERS